MVIPYMPMLVPPVCWTGYGNLHFIALLLPFCISVLWLNMILKLFSKLSLKCYKLGEQSSPYSNHVKTL